LRKALEAAGLRGLLAAGNGIDDFGLGLALDDDEIELKDRKPVLDRERGLGADDDREAVFLGLPFKARCQIDARRRTPNSLNFLSEPILPTTASAGC